MTAGRWRSDYDGAETTDPSELDIDHVVPLAEAWRSGAAAWETDQRARFANDQTNLWAVSASSNRSKGDDDPAGWRPPVASIHCTYARRWVTVKVAYGLAADSRERDALGQMLDTCTSAGPAPSTTVPPAPSTPPAGAAHYPNCAAARAAGATPLHRGDPGYQPGLDGDGDGTACE